MTLNTKRMLALFFVFIIGSSNSFPCYDQQTKVHREVGERQICCNGKVFPKLENMECVNNTLIIRIPAARTFKKCKNKRKWRSKFKKWVKKGQRNIQKDVNVKFIMDGH